MSPNAFLARNPLSIFWLRSNMTLLCRHSLHVASEMPRYRNFALQVLNLLPPVVEHLSSFLVLYSRLVLLHASFIKWSYPFVDLQS